jgi:hypothetical protein
MGENHYKTPETDIQREEYGFMLAYSFLLQLK